MEEDFGLVELSDESSFSSFEDLDDDMHCLWPRDPLVYGEPSEEKPAEEDRAVEGQDDRGDELPAWLDPVIDVVKPDDAVEEGGEAASPSDKEFKGIDAVVASPENGEVKDRKGSAVLASPEDGEGNDVKGSEVSSQDKDDARSDDCVWCQKDKGPLSGIRDIEDLDPEVYAAVQEITEMLEPSEADAQMLEPTVPAADDKIDDEGGPRLVDKDWDCAASTSTDYSEEEESTDECSCDECSCDEDEDEDEDLDEDDDSSEEYDSEDEGDGEDSSEEDDTDDEGDEEDSSEEDDTDDDGDEDSSEEDDTDDEGDEEDSSEEDDTDDDDCVCNKYYRLDDDIIEAKEHLSAAEERKEEEKHEVVKGDEETAGEEKEPQIDLVDPYTTEAWFDCKSDCEDEFEDAQEDVKSVEVEGN